MIISAIFLVKPSLRPPARKDVPSQYARPGLSSGLPMPLRLYRLQPARTRFAVDAFQVTFGRKPIPEHVIIEVVQTRGFRLTVSLLSRITRLKRYPLDPSVSPDLNFVQKDVERINRGEECQHIADRGRRNPGGASPV